MNILKQSSFFKVVAFMSAMFLLTSIACGSNATPQKVGEVKPANATEATATKAPVQKAEVKPTEAPVQPAEGTPTQSPAQVAEAPTDTPAPPEAQTFKAGDIVNIGNNVLVVLGWEEVAGADFAKPDKDKKFIAVEVLIVNKSQSFASISDFAQMSLKDNTGQKYTPDGKASIASNGPTFRGRFAPGERQRGKVGFHIPTTVQGLQFVFEAEFPGTGNKAIVDLGASPKRVEPPAELAGETNQQTFKVGNVVEVGTLSFIINGVTSPEGTYFFKPEQGNKFLAVDITIENKGQNLDHISSMMGMSLKDASGREYRWDLMATGASGDPLKDGKLAPGEKMRGQVGFQIPANVTGLVFVFDSNARRAVRAFVALP